MRNDILALPDRRRLVGLSLIYAALMLYSSTVIGPGGINFVYLDPTEALRTFLATPYVMHGSDQRADWIGNLLMLVPFGFLLTGAFWPRRVALKPGAMLGALAMCGVTILAIKYLQLFFPPRTVTLNYILAQWLGSAIGCAACAIWQEGIGRSNGRRDLTAALVLGLWLYIGALCLFVLMPLDFALDAADLRAQLVRLPDTLWILPGNGRPPLVRAVVIVTASVAFVPVGMLLTFVRKGVYQVRRSLLSVTGLGMLLTIGLYLLSALVISAYPVLPAVLYRTAGIVAGAAAIKWLVRQDMEAMRVRLRRLVPWAALGYLICVLLVNRLLSVHWRSFDQVVTQTYRLGLLPLFDYYIVTKAEAAKNIVGHAVLYAPVGVMLWARYGGAVGRRAFVAAAGLSFAVEIGRYFRPGLEGDFNAVVVAGLSATLAAQGMPAVWAMVEALVRQSAIIPERRWNQRRTRPDEPAGEIEFL